MRGAVRTLRRDRWPIDSVVHVGVVAIALALWAQALASLDLRSMNDLGLISVLPLEMAGAVGLLTAGFFLALCRRQYVPGVLLLYLVALVLALYGTVVLVNEFPRIEATWRHVGYIEYIMRNRQVDPLLNAYFNWPGFFAAGALLTEAAGLETALSLARWAPMALDLLTIGPLLLLFLSLSDDARAAWAGVWFYFVTAWVGQDYFSPQGWSFFLHLVVLAIALRWFTGAGGALPVWLVPPAGSGRVASVLRALASWAAAPGPGAVESTPQQRAALAGIAILLCAALVSSHQLTPFITLASIAGLVALQRCRLGGLPVLMSVLIGAWLAFMAITFMRGHVESLLAEIGRVDSVVQSSVAERLSGSPEHVFITRFRVVFTLAVCLLAAAGAVRRALQGRSDVAAAALALAPFIVLPLQSYGGEVALRVYFFALPGIAFLLARLFFPGAVLDASRWECSAAMAASVVLTVGFLLARYGNERMDFFTAQEFEAMEEFHRLVDDGLRRDAPAEPQTDRTLVLLPSWNTPLRFEREELYRYYIVMAAQNRPIAVLSNADIETVLQDVARTPHREAYLISTRSQKAHLELLYGLAPSALDAFTEAMELSGAATMVYRNRDATILHLQALNGAVNQ